MYNIQRFTPISHTQDPSDTGSINVLDTEAYDIKSLQQ